MKRMLFIALVTGFLTPWVSGFTSSSAGASSSASSRGVVTVGMYDGFESGNYSSAPWFHTNTTIQSSYRFGGTNAVRLSGTNSVLVLTNDSTGYSNITLYYARIPRKLISAYNLVIKYSLNAGTNWTVIETLNWNTPYKWVFKTVPFPAGANNNPSIQIMWEMKKVKVSSDTNFDGVYLDDVMIRGQ